MTMVMTTTTKNARRVSPAARTVACEGRTATAANVAGTATRVSTTTMISSQPTAP